MSHLANERRAYFYWGNVTLPWFQHLSVASFVKQHPNWQVTLWRPAPDEQATYDAGRCYFPDVEVLPNVNFAEVNVEQTTCTSVTGYDASITWTQTIRSDALRNWLLYEHGGLWSDMDVLWFRSVEDSSLDNGKVSMVWESNWSMVYIGVLAAERGSEAMAMLCAKQREKSPAVQNPGGQSPFAAKLWIETFGDPEKIPGFVCAKMTDFYEPPWSVACHAYGARIPWGSLTPENYANKIIDMSVADCVSAILKVLR